MTSLINMVEYINFMVHSVILSKEDDKGNITYYTTNDDYDHSLLCDLIDDEDIHEIKTGGV